MRIGEIDLQRVYDRMYLGSTKRIHYLNSSKAQNGNNAKKNDSRL